MGNQVITEVKSHKHLSVFLSNDCSWHEHIDYVNENAWGRINVVRSLKFYLDKKSLKTIYLTSIRPVLEYTYVIKGNCTSYEEQKLDKNRLRLLLNLCHYMHFTR